MKTAYVLLLLGLLFAAAYSRPVEEDEPLEDEPLEDETPEGNHTWLQKQRTWDQADLWTNS